MIFMENNTILDITCLNKTYKQGHEEIRVLENLDFVIRRGEFVSIVGPSGSGKSTLLNIIGLLDNDYDGKVRLFGRNMEKTDEEKKAALRLAHLGFVFQFDSLLPEFTVHENIEMPAMLLAHSVKKNVAEPGIAAPEKKADPSADELLKRFNLEEISSKFPMEISGGEKQRSAMMRALRNGPELLIADEPTGNLDSKNSCEIVELLKASNKKYGQTLIIITHDESIALQADR